MKLSLVNYQFVLENYLCIYLHIEISVSVNNQFVGKFFLITIYRPFLEKGSHQLIVYRGIYR